MQLGAHKDEEPKFEDEDYLAGYSQDPYNTPEDCNDKLETLQIYKSGNCSYPAK
jgi:hypothetical protein